MLNRTDFAKVFIAGLAAHAEIQCRLIENPHWIVEVIFDEQKHPPAAIGQLCAQCLQVHREAEQNRGLATYEIMLLGGMKTSPARGNSPTALQPGEWGVDVVETTSSAQFLANVNWDTMIQDKPPEQIFKVLDVVKA